MVRGGGEGGRDRGGEEQDLSSFDNFTASRASTTANHDHAVEDESVA